MPQNLAKLPYFKEFQYDVFEQSGKKFKDTGSAGVRKHPGAARMSSRPVHRDIVRLARSGLHLIADDNRSQASTHEGPNLSVDTTCRVRTAQRGFILQQDNYPNHKSKLFTEWFRDNIVPLLLWLSRSPDFNPIENLWDELELQVKDPVANREHEKFPQLTTAQENIPQDKISKPIKSMPR
ncbi:hypothetical protein TELCIR_06411 [Teladorsagia circumcincta]|uniref:Tc1-like transposase DDE domain-containing protein n=1 Tax=Teladorsagia circumcincta TaxID=45464 RepID=A0A2G9UN25_TELCI|nr:hypothetical protein TELCIR_06411 [Teladorsagia circumcincta]